METKGIRFDERATAAKYLIQTRDALADVVSGLSDAEWNFKPAPDRWSIAEILEHVVLVERGLQQRIEEIRNAGAEAPGHPAQPIDRFIVEEIPRRKNRLHAPERVQPTGRWTASQALTEFFHARRRTLELLASAPSLSGRTLPHPIFGPWDGYQWILATAAHSARHTEQMREVKAGSRFLQPVAAAGA